VSFGALDQPKALGSGPQNRGHPRPEPRIYWENALKTHKKPGKTGLFCILRLA
jgi:hypothetical protein